MLMSSSLARMSGDELSDQQLYERLKAKYSRETYTASQAVEQATLENGQSKSTSPGTEIRVCQTCQGSGVEKTDYHFRILEVACQVTGANNGSLGHTLNLAMAQKMCTGCHGERVTIQA